MKAVVAIRGLVSEAASLAWGIGSVIFSAERVPRDVEHLEKILRRFDLPNRRMNSARCAPSGVRIYPGFNALYYSFYLAGLRSMAGMGLSYRSGGFPAFGHHGLALETEEREPRRIFLSASDGPGLQPVALAWSHVYGKANLDAEQVPAGATARCLAIGPSFPVRLWGPAAACVRSLSNFVLCRGRVDSAREHFANFWRQYRYRLPLAAYQPGASDSGYVFSASSLWKEEAATNRFRAHFIEVCRAFPGLEFEGGFIRRQRDDVPGFERLTVGSRYPAGEYYRKLKRSAVVFNTPAVASCHGWKLAEFLALGKAIISTPPIRALPAPLEHGTHVHFVDGSPAAIRAALERLIADGEYRQGLEENARAYYLRYLSPMQVIQRAFDAAGKEPT